MTEQTTIRGIIYDMGDIIYDATVWRRWLHTCLTAEHSLDRTYRDIFSIWDDEYLKDVHLGRRAYDEAFDAFLTALGYDAPERAAITSVSLERKQEIEAATGPFPDVPETLADLSRQGYVQAILSDSEAQPEDLRRRLRSWKIDRYFAHVVSSAGLGHRKPEPAAYTYTLDLMQLAPSACAFVGHERDELDGAREAGLLAVAFNYEPGVAADIFIPRFSLLTEVLP